MADPKGIEPFQRDLEFLVQPLHYGPIKVVVKEGV